MCKVRVNKYSIQWLLKYTIISYSLLFVVTGLLGYKLHGGFSIEHTTVASSLLLGTILTTVIVCAIVDEQIVGRIRRK